MNCCIVCKVTFPINASADKQYCTPCKKQKNKEYKKIYYQRKTGKVKKIKKYENLKYLITTRKNSMISIYEIYGFVGKINRPTLRTYFHTIRKETQLKIKIKKEWVYVN